VKENTVIFQCGSRKQVDAVFKILFILKRLAVSSPSWRLSLLPRLPHINVLYVGTAVLSDSNMLRENRLDGTICLRMPG
jgi:hypothetical protein